MRLETTLVIEQNRRRIAEAEVRRLQRAQRTSETDGAAQQAFLDRLSHCLRLPLYSQLGLTRLFEQEPCSSRQHEYVQLMQRNTENLLVALNDLVGPARPAAAPIQSGTVPAEVLAPKPDSALQRDFRE